MEQKYPTNIKKAKFMSLLLIHSGWTNFDKI